MQWLSPVGGNNLPTGQVRPSPFSQLVYTNNDSYIIQYGDLRKIHKAASRGQVSKLQKMTVKKKTINLNVKDARKRTALHWACVNGHAEVVTFLVDRKCQLDVLDGENRTPLMKALQCQREDCANILVDSGAGLNIVDVYGNTALHYAVYNKNLSVVAKLLSHGAVIETQNKASLTPLLLAITKRSEQIVEFLLTKNANANAVNSFKCTALMFAVCHGSSEIVGMLLLRNVDVFAEDTCGMTAVRYAIACGFDHIHQQLLEYIQKLSKNAGPDQMIPSESKQKDKEENSWDLESDRETVSQKDVCLPKATPQKEFHTISEKLEESPHKDGLLKPTCGMKVSIPNKALEMKHIQTFKAVDVSSVESIFSPFGKPTTENSQPTKLEEDFSLATKEEATKRVTGQQENDTGIIEQAPQDQTNKIPTSESRQKEDTKSSSDSEIISESDTQNYVCLTEATYQKEIKTINGKIEESTEKPSDFEPAIEMQNSVLNKALERRNKQTLRTDNMLTLKSGKETYAESRWSSKVSHAHENENNLLHENRMLKKEIAMLKLEIAKLKHQHQEKENKYFKDIKILKEKNAELQMTLKLKEESLTKRASQYSGQLKVLMAENTELTSKLKEKQDKEIREREIESYHPRLASAVQDREQIVTSRKSQGLAFHTAGDACLQGKINVDVNNTIYNNEVLHQPLSEAQRKSKSLKINLNYAGDALRENTLVSEHAQRERDETQYQMKKAEHIYQNEQDNVNIHDEQQESLEQKLFQLQSKNLWLRQQLIHAHKKTDNKSKITINIPLLERKMQHHLLKEKNEEIFNYNKHLKDCIYKYEKEKEEREVIVRQLQKRLADLNKQCVSETSLELTSHDHINLKDEI
ncbi:ankyrin repeat domain-containing protein 30B-like isoform X1 [Macaca nemestrina]|uniref:ankyrin repeat domain-containing protein 30B-like isoform X1 n=2 Tax=Macaca nemestrina TaxID=9545 RepID=UPI0039B83C4B